VLTVRQILELATNVIHLQLLGDFPRNIHTMGAGFSPEGILFQTSWAKQIPDRPEIDVTRQTARPWLPIKM